MMLVTMTSSDRIEIDPAIAGGQAVIRGTRVPATLVVGSLAGGMSFEEVQREYDLAPEDIRAALKYVSEIAARESVHPTKYQPWRSAEYPRLRREIVGVVWLPNQLRIEISDDGAGVPTLAVSFDLVRAYQGLDEGHRLLDCPDWSGERALIYSSHTSAYLAAVRRNAAGMLDNLDLVHWMITSCNECVDVISEHEPVVGPLVSR
jgi:uncharacterized protein (DUF433 family)